MHMLTCTDLHKQSCSQSTLCLEAAMCLQARWTGAHALQTTLLTAPHCRRFGRARTRLKLLTRQLLLRTHLKPLAHQLLTAGDKTVTVAWAIHTRWAVLETTTYVVAECSLVAKQLRSKGGRGTEAVSDAKERPVQEPKACCLCGCRRRCCSHTTSSGRRQRPEQQQVPRRRGSGRAEGKAAGGAHMHARANAHSHAKRTYTHSHTHAHARRAQQRSCTSTDEAIKICLSHVCRKLCQQPHGARDTEQGSGRWQALSKAAGRR